MADAPMLRVTLVYSDAARQTTEVSLLLPAASTLQQALQASGLLARYPALNGPDVNVGVWGKVVAVDHILQDLDRVEVYRPLTVDPKVARRTRFKGQGARTTGLFSQKRQGAKAGYGG